MKPSVRPWFLGILLLAATSCARGDRVSQSEAESPAPEAGAQKDAGGEVSGQRAVPAVFEAELETFKAKVRPAGPAMADLTRHFFMLWEQGDLAGSVPKSALEQVVLHKAPGREGNDYFMVWLEEKGKDMSRERACDELYQAQVELAAGRPEIRYFFCGRKPGFELLSSYRHDEAGWTKFD